MVLTESFYCNKAVKQTIFLILLSFYCHKTKQEPRNSVNSAFVGSCVLFELLGGEIYLAVYWYTFVHFILHIHPILHFCVPRLNFLEPKWSQLFLFTI